MEDYTYNFANEPNNQCNVQRWSKLWRLMVRFVNETFPHARGAAVHNALWYAPLWTLCVWVDVRACRISMRGAVREHRA